jgi:hypothetical protein
VTETARPEQQPSHELFTFLAQVSREMADEYKRIRARAREDPGTAGDEGEENWAEVLRGWLPATYQIEAKGRLIGHNGQITPQIDIVVLKPSYPRKLVKKKVFLAGGVAAAFECKNTLTAAHVDEAIDTCFEVKSLYVPRQGSPYRELRSPVVYGLPAHSHSWRAPGSTPLQNIGDALQMAGERKVTHPRLGLDVLCVADLATWTPFTTSYYGGPAMKPSFPVPGYPDGCLSTSYFQLSEVFQGIHRRDFAPFGVLVCSRMSRLAWEEPSCRDMADYYRLSKLFGAGEGVAGRAWPLDVYSDEVRLRIMQGQLVNGGVWNEWSLGIM